MKIAVFLPNYIGDILMTTPAIRYLKLNHPSSEITAVVKECYKELVDENPNVGGIIAKSSKYKLLKDIIALKPDAVVLFRTTFSNSLAAFASGAKYSVGVKEDLSNLFLKSAVPADKKRPYRAECLALTKKLLNDYLKLSAPVEVDLTKIDFTGWNKDEIRNTVKRKLEMLGVDTLKKLITISPVATRKTKMLSTAGYIKLFSLLKLKYADCQIVLAGSVKDRDYCLNLAREAGVKFIAGDFNLKELAAMISTSELFISPDTGASYIAQAVGAKTFIYFTSTDPEKYGPFCEKTKIVYKPVSCSPCYKDECFQINKYLCVESIKPEEIVDKISGLES